MSRFLRWCDGYWFRPAPLADLAVLRIVAFGSQLLLFRPPLASQIAQTQADGSLYVPLPALKVLLLPFGGWGTVRPSELGIEIAWVLAVVAGAAATVGLFTRVATFGAAYTNTLLIAHRYSFRELHHGEALLIITLWVLAVAPCGAALSLDAIRRRLARARRTRRFEPQSPAELTSPHARWPLLLVQWTLVLAYLSAGATKLYRSGLDWFNGYTMTHFFVADGLRQGSAPALALAHLPPVAHIPLSIVSVLFELTFALAVILPPVAWLYVLVGTAFHTAIYVVQRAPFFQYIVLYTVLLPSVRRFRPVWLRLPFPRGRWTVACDQSGWSCIRSLTLLDVLDARGRLEFRDLARAPAPAGASAGAEPGGGTALQVLGPDGVAYRGFGAFRELTRALPVLWPLAAVLRLPGVARLAERIGRGSGGRQSSALPGRRPGALTDPDER